MSFAARHPVVWHVAEAEGVAGILRDGLLPAEALMRRADRVSDANRDRFVPLPCGALLRFQQMRDARLAPSLRGRFSGQPALWRRFVDSHVFFWAAAWRRDGFLKATRRERLKHEPEAASPRVLAFDTPTLLEGVDEDAFFSVYNSGSTVMGAYRTPRDEALFQPLSRWPAAKPAAELVIRAAMPAARVQAALRSIEPA